MRLGVLDALSFVSSSAAQGKFGFQTVRSLGREHFSATVQEVHQKIFAAQSLDHQRSLSTLLRQSCPRRVETRQYNQRTVRSIQVHGLLDAKQRRQIEMNLLGWLKSQIQAVFSIYQHTDEQTREIRYELRQNLGSIQLDKHNRPSKVEKETRENRIVCGKTPHVPSRYS